MPWLDADIGGGGPCRQAEVCRDGQENFGQGQYLNTQAAADPSKGGDAALKGKRLPNQLNSAFFEGVRERKGGYLGLQFKPSTALDVNLNVFKSKLDADNYNTSAFAELATIVNNGGLIKDYTTGYLPVAVSNTYNDLLPSLNLRWDINQGLIGRFSASRTLGRPNFSQLAGSLTGVNDTTYTASAGNPYLKPITANNLDVSLGWYYARRAYIAASVFQQNIHDYVKPGTSIQRLFDITKFANTKDEKNSYSDYTVSSFSGKKARLNGFELSGEQPIGLGFGIIANVTYANSKDQDGIPLVYTSKYTYNLRGIYEDDKLSASLAWNYRTKYSIGFSGNGVDTVNPTTLVRTGANYAAAQGTLSASVSCKISESLSVTLDGNNLLNPVRR